MDIQEEIKSLKAHIALLEKQIADEKKQEEPKFERVAEGDFFYFVSITPCNNFNNVLCVDKTRDTHATRDDCFFNNNNYFLSEERAIEVAEKIKMLLKFERLHDTFCPDYVPNWDCNDEKKYCVYYDNDVKSYKCNYVKTCKENNVYFSSEEITRKVCDILNAEKENEDD